MFEAARNSIQRTILEGTTFDFRSLPRFHSKEQASAVTQVRRTKHAEGAVAAQVRAARAMLCWSQIELAARAGVAHRTLADLETGRRDPRDGTVERLVAVLAEAGIALSDDGSRIVVTWTRPGPNSQA